MTEFFDVCIPTRLVFGVDALESLSKLPFPGDRCLIVTTNGRSVRRYGTLERVEKLLRLRGVRPYLFEKCLPNPTREHVMEAAELCRKEGINVVLGLGGGSAIDSAKAIAAMATNPGDLWDYITGGTGKGRKFVNKPLPVVAITTTAGTGTEADPWAVITHTERKEKIGFGTRDTYPTLSIVDPKLMVTVPPKLTAYQGFDALFHSLEGYVHKGHSPLSDLFALEAVRRIAKSLPEAVSNGENIEARSDVALGNTLSGLVESTSGCTSEHSIEHALSALRTDLTHGLGLILISLPYFRLLIAKGAVPERFVELARALGKADAERPEDFLTALENLQKACGVAGGKLRDQGFAEADLPEAVRIARDTMGGLFLCDPVEVTDEDVLTILREAY